MKYQIVIIGLIGFLVAISVYTALLFNHYQKVSLALKEQIQQYLILKSEQAKSRNDRAHAAFCVQSVLDGGKDFTLDFCLNTFLKQ